jgi:hypothetical protein
MKEQIVRPTQAGISTIIENPIGVLEKLGKYEFIYDYNANHGIFSEFGEPLLKPFGFDGDGAELPSPIRGCFGNTSSNSSIARCGSIPPPVQNFPQPVKVNSEPQVGFFSKGNIVKVLRFDGNNAIIQNVHYKSTDPTIKKGFLSEYILNKKELSIPKDYLKKVDDNLAVTVSTGINYGANMKAQKTTFVNVPTPNPPIMIENGVEETTETESFFKGKNNLLIIAGAFFIGYLLFSDNKD